MAEKTLKTRIQLVRNTEATLSAKNPDTLTGEFYIIENNNNTGKFRFKVGKTGKKLNELDFYEDNLLEQLGIDVSNPDYNQILVYNGQTGHWENEKFFDETEFTYDGESGLHIVGYDEAESGQMLVKDAVQGLRWIKPLDSSALSQAVQNANNFATNAANSALASGSSAAQSAASATQAAQINEQTMAWVNDKFWWGTAEEYNALESVNEGTFYFVRAE